MVLFSKLHDKFHRKFSMAVSLEHAIERLSCDLRKSEESFDVVDHSPLYSCERLKTRRATCPSILTIGKKVNLVYSDPGGWKRK